MTDTFLVDAARILDATPVPTFERYPTLDATTGTPGPAVRVPQR